MHPINRRARINHGNWEGFAPGVTLATLSDGCDIRAPLPAAITRPPAAACEDNIGEGPIRVTDTRLTAALGQLLDSRN
jgi:hypothetical protein